MEKIGGKTKEVSFSSLQAKPEAPSQKWAIEEKGRNGGNSYAAGYRQLLLALSVTVAQELRNIN